MKNLLIPQAFVQYKLINSLKKAANKASKIKKSTFGVSPMQSIVPMAKIVGSYKPSCVINKTKVPTSSKDQYRLDTDFLNIENYKLSFLTPEIRLYRVIPAGPGNKSAQYKPFYFPVTSEFNLGKDGNLDFSKSFSASAAVLKSFSIDFVGNNPYAFGVGMLEASLQIDIDSLAVLFETPDSSYAELADLSLIHI